MVYIYEKVIQGKSYYYLRISKRVGGKVVVKDIAYLGNDLLKIEGKLDQLPKKYKADIRKAHRNIRKYIESGYCLSLVQKRKLKKNLYFSKEGFEQIEAAREHYKKQFKKLDEQTQEEIYKDFLIDFAYNTTSIEGNTITLQETQRLLLEHLTPKDKTLREIYDVQNTEKVFLELLHKKPRITEKLLIYVHDELLKNIDVRKGYRMHESRVFRARFKVTPAKYVRTDMKLLMTWYREQKRKLHPLVLTSLFHHKFEKIHPFADGNGRTGRMLLSYMLIQANYPPMIVYKKHRKEYRKALESADKAGINEIDPKYYKELCMYLGEEFLESYWSNFLV